MFFFFFQNTAETLQKHISMMSAGGLEDILFYVISTKELPASTFSCFSDSSFWSSEAESFHTHPPRLQAVSVLCYLERQYALWPGHGIWILLVGSSGAQIMCAGRSTWCPWDWNQYAFNLVQVQANKEQKGANLIVLLLF